MVTVDDKILSDVVESVIPSFEEAKKLFPSLLARSEKAWKQKEDKGDIKDPDILLHYEQLYRCGFTQGVVMEWVTCFMSMLDDMTKLSDKEKTEFLKIMSYVLKASEN